MSDLFTFCSFASDRFLGAVILAGHRAPLEAAAAAYQLGIHPGGELLVLHSPPHLSAEEKRWHNENLNRLLSIEELQAKGCKFSSEMTAEECVNVASITAGVVPE